MKKILTNITRSFAAIVFVALASSSAYADGLVLLGTNHTQLVPPQSALILHARGNSGTETGGVSWNGTSNVTFGDTQTPHNRTFALNEIGITNASNLGILFNINEPNGQNKELVTVDFLVLTAYDSNGNSVFSASLLGAPLTLEQIKGGQGSNSDYVFGLDSAAAARLQLALNANPNLRLGLSASISDVQGGQERFSFGGIAGPPAAVPEPTTMLLLGTGLAGVAAKARKRRKALKE